MTRIAAAVWQGLLCLISPLLLLTSAIVLAGTDLSFALFGKRRPVKATPLNPRTASVIIPNWNGRDLLEKFLPSVVAALAGEPGNEIVVVDNASTDGSLELLRHQFPNVRVLALNRNLGFGGGSNAGIAAAKNDVVVLLNNDMRVDPNFLKPLLEPFADELVFSVSCQIFFPDPLKRREETGLTQTWWHGGRLRVSHRVDPDIQQPFPCAYPGGGSSAFDRRKFLELGGFDEILRPFYFEDTDLGQLAWKRGWKVLYQPESVVYHEHRGTIGKNFSGSFIEGVLRKNVVLYCWKNIHDWGMLGSHFWACYRNSLAALFSGNAEDRYTFSGLWRAFLQLPEAAKARWRARTLAVISDREAFRRQLGGYYRDRFEASEPAKSERLQILFLSPYPIEPPVHGGAVFMGETLKALAPLADIHLLSFLDHSGQLEAQQPLADICASAQFPVRHLIPPRHPSTALPHSIREFADPDFTWAMHRTIFLKKVNVVQIDYTILGQYAEQYRHIPCMLFEHDIFFQSLWRGMKKRGFTFVGLLEYVRMLRYELRMLKRVTRVQVCSQENAAYLLDYVPELRNRIDPGLRTVVDTRSYQFMTEGREPNTMLFLGSFRHTPNLEALRWFTRQVLPKVVQTNPEATLVVVGASPPDEVTALREHPNIRLVGFVDDVRAVLSRYAVFVCPILSGSGVRVKLLEAFAAGIPVVSTAIGAEGLASQSGDVCELADSAEAFAAAVANLFSNQEYADALASRARHLVEAEKDASRVTFQLEACYRTEVQRCKNASARTARAMVARQA